MPVPMTARATLRYADNFVINSNLGSASYLFISNSVFDPDGVSTGHQPYYFDRYAAIYNKYVVMNSRIHVSATIESSSGQCIGLGLYGYAINSVTIDIAGLD